MTGNTAEVLAAEASKLALLVGSVCDRALTIGFGVLDIHFSGYTPPDGDGRQRTHKVFSAYHPWRLEAASQVLVGSGDASSEIGDALRLLSGRRVLDAEALQPGYMARIQFDEGMVVWVFPSDSRYFDRGSFEDVGAPWFITDSESSEDSAHDGPAVR